jgi:hypothetical protein
MARPCSEVEQPEEMIGAYENKSRKYHGRTEESHKNVKEHRFTR